MKRGVCKYAVPSFLPSTLIPISIYIRAVGDVNACVMREAVAVPRSPFGSVDSFFFSLLPSFFNPFHEWAKGGKGANPDALGVCACGFFSSRGDESGYGKGSFHCFSRLACSLLSLFYAIVFSFECRRLLLYFLVFFFLMFYGRGLLTEIGG